jgi:Arc/MetJ-type ribon-helix-helix transcriptional regulator
MQDKSPAMKATESPNKSTRITVTLDSHDYDQVTQAAKRHRVSASWVVREAVRSYLTSKQNPNDCEITKPKAHEKDQRPA